MFDPSEIAKLGLDGVLAAAVVALWKKIGDNEKRHQTEETTLRQERTALSDRMVVLLEKLIDKAKPKDDP